MLINFTRMYKVILQYITPDTTKARVEKPLYHFTEKYFLLQMY